MDNVVRRGLSLLAFAIAAVVAVPAGAAAQQHEPPREDLYEGRMGEGKRATDRRMARQARIRRAAPAAAAAAPAPESPAASSPVAAASGSSPAAPASPAASSPATPAAPAYPPPADGVTLSDDAPDAPPIIGVIGGDQSNGPSPTPEPSTMLLMGTGLAGLYRLSRRRRE